MVDMAPRPDWALGLPRDNPMDVSQAVSHGRRVARVVDARVSTGPVDLPASEGRATGHWGVWDREGEVRGPPASGASLSHPTRATGPTPSNWPLLKSPHRIDPPAPSAGLAGFRLAFPGSKEGSLTDFER
jgi:hypothetical protein